MNSSIRQDPGTRSFHLSWNSHSWLASCLEWLCEVGRSWMVTGCPENHEASVFWVFSSMTSCGNWDSGAMALEPLLNAHVAHRFTNTLGSANTWLLLTEFEITWPSKSSWPMPAPSISIKRVLPSVPIMSQDNWYSIAKILWVELIASKWMRDEVLTLATYHSVIHFESNSWK